MLLRFAFYCLVFLIGLMPGYGQQKFTRYNVDEGLSQSSVYSIFQDSRGFMWFGTGNGLNRFDGYRFETYKSTPDSKTGLKNSFMTAKVLEDKQGDLWFGTRSGGIHKYHSKENRFEQVRIFNSEMQNTFDGELIGFDSNNNLWFGNGSKLIGSYDPVTRRTRLVPLPDKLQYSGADALNRSGLIVNDTIYFIGTNKFISFSIRHNKFEALLEEDFQKTGSVYILSFCLDTLKKVLWLGTEKGVMEYHLNSRQRKWIDLTGKFDTPFAYVITKDAYDRLWIGTVKSGLLRYDLKDGAVRVFQNNRNDPQSLSFDIVRTLYIDRSDNLWVGTDGGGLNKTDLKPVRFPAYAKDTFIKCFYEDSDRTIWVGTYEKGICQINRQTGAQKLIRRNSPFGNIVSVITTDLYGNLLVGSNNGIDYYVNGKFTQVPAFSDSEKLEGTYLVYSLHHTREKTTLVATRLGLLEGKYVNGRLDTLKYVGNHKSIFLQLHQTRDGRIWAAAAGNSYLYVWRYKQGYLTLTDSLLRQSSVRCFYEDTIKNLLWMASEQGLIRYDLTTDKAEYISTNNGLSDNYLYAVLPDKSGRLWLSSNKGIMCYNPENGECRNYTVSDGLQSNEFNTGAFYRSTAGELFFGGIHGFNAFYPSAVTDNLHVPQVVLTALKINDGNVPAGLMNSGVIHLPYDSSTVSFEFAGLEYTNAPGNRYRYLLRGWDNEWVEAGTDRFARYSNLPAGSYTFLVQSGNSDAVWSSETALLTFIIAPPFWRQWWFIVLMAGLLLALLVIYIRRVVSRRLNEKLRELEKQQAVQRERERISKDMHDDLGTGLSRVAIQSELLKHKLKANENAEQQAEKIVQASRELVDNLSEIVWALNPRHDDVPGLLAYLREFTTDLFEEQDVRCVFRFPERLQHHSLPSEVRRNIYLILKEALNNSAKYAAATEICLEMQEEPHAVIFIAGDDGKGFDQDTTRQFGNGLVNMKRRAAHIQAQLTFHSAPGKGTRVELRVELRAER